MSNLRLIRAPGYEGMDRRQQADLSESQFDDLAERVCKHQTIADIQRTLSENTEKTNEIYDLLVTLKGAGRTASWVGTGLMWSGKVAAGAAALWAAWHGLKK